MLEVAVVIGTEGRALHWHEPPHRSSVALPDSRALWDALWANRTVLSGVAHTHPGGGEPSPSTEDLTTFAACEAALGVRLSWWIATRDRCVRFGFRGPGRLDYAALDETSGPWLPELRRRSDLGGAP
jgi:proteasome lid subunit RPN8/RPN11